MDLLLHLWTASREKSQLSKPSKEILTHLGQVLYVLRKRSHNFTTLTAMHYNWILRVENKLVLGQAKTSWRLRINTGIKWVWLQKMQFKIRLKNKEISVKFCDWVGKEGDIIDQGKKKMWLQTVSIGKKTQPVYYNRLFQHI